MSMPHPPPPAAEPEDYEGPPVPEPPRRVPFGIVLVTALLGIVTVLILTMTVAAVDAFSFDDSVGRAAAGGALMTLLAVLAALTGAVAWSFARNGNQIGALVVGAAVALIGLIMMGTSLSGGSTDGVGYGMIGLVLGLLITLLPLLGDGPGYLAARRVWARAERDWLREMTAPPAPAAAAWPGAPGYPGQFPPVYPGYAPPPQGWPGQPMPPQQWAPPGLQPQPGLQPGFPPQPGQWVEAQGPTAARPLPPPPGPEDWTEVRPPESAPDSDSGNPQP